MQWRASISGRAHSRFHAAHRDNLPVHPPAGARISSSNRTAISLGLFAAVFVYDGTAVGLELDAQRAEVGRIRPVRVLIVAGAGRIRLNADGPVTISDLSGTPVHQALVLSQTAAAPANEGGIRLADRDYPPPGLRMSRADAGTIAVSVERDGTWLPPTEYAGDLVLQADGAGQLAAVNHVELEEYVAAVVAQEAWPTFHDEAFRAQAVTSRTYVLFQMSRRPDAAIDVTATQSSQVYRGVRRDEIGRRARAAAEYTRGIVLTYRAEDGRDQLFCAYYSAACGGCSQPGAAFGPESDVPPLRGGVRCDDCRIAPGDTYRWGPVSLAITDVLGRLAGRIPEFGSFATIESIEPLERTAEGRPVTLRIVAGDLQQTILAERFRMLLDPAQIRSTDFRVAVENGQVIFRDGKGFGHGLGLCQWGAQGKALKGQRAGQILTYYFPGARVVKAY